jgi:hypothetical protein
MLVQLMHSRKLLLQKGLRACIKDLVQPWPEVFLPMRHASLLMRLPGQAWDDGTSNQIVLYLQEFKRNRANWEMACSLFESCLGLFLIIHSLFG